MPDPEIQNTQEVDDLGDIAAFKARLVGKSAGGFMGWEKKPDPNAQAHDSPEPEAPPIVGDPAPTGEGEEAPPGEPPAEAEPAEGKSNEETPEGALEALLAKYGSEEKLADAYVHLQKRFTGNTEETKELREFINEHFELDVEGKPQLRSEVAARRLGQERAPTGKIDVNAIRAEVQAKYQKLADKTEDPDAIMDEAKESIAAEVRERTDAAKRQLRDEGSRMAMEAAKASEAFFRTHPDAESLIDQMDAWVSELGPPEVQVRILKENPRILNRIYRAEKMERDFKASMKAALDKGIEIGRSEVNPAASANAESSQRSTSRNLGPASDDADFKARVVGAGKKSVVGALIGGRST